MSIRYLLQLNKLPQNLMTSSSNMDLWPLTLSVDQQGVLFSRRLQVEVSHHLKVWLELDLRPRYSLTWSASSCGWWCEVSVPLHGGLLCRAAWVSSQHGDWISPRASNSGKQGRAVMPSVSELQSSTPSCWLCFIGYTDQPLYNEGGNYTKV